jgi:hypothetical protein
MTIARADAGRIDIRSREPISAGKNFFGAALILAGVALLLLPGLGTLTLVVGFLLLDVPGQYETEKWLIARGLLWPTNWLRRRAGSPPLQVSWLDAWQADAACPVPMRSPPATAAVDKGSWR